MTIELTINDRPVTARAGQCLVQAAAEAGIKLDEAEQLVKKALELEPNAGHILDSLGWVYYQKGDYPRAIDNLKAAIEQMEAAPDPVVRGFQTHDALSAATPDHPVVLERADGHAYIVNAKVIALMGIGADTKTPEGGEIIRDASGKPTGVLVDIAQDAEIIDCDHAQFRIDDARRRFPSAARRTRCHHRAPGCARCSTCSSPSR